MYVDSLRTTASTHKQMAMSAYNIKKNMHNYFICVHALYLPHLEVHYSTLFFHRVKGFLINAHHNY